MTDAMYGLLNGEECAANQQEDNSIGIEFTDKTQGNLTAQQAGKEYGKTPTGAYSNEVSWGSSTANITLYTNSNKTPSSVLQIAKYYIVYKASDGIYAFGCVNGRPNVKKTTDVATLGNDYKWNVIANGTGYRFTCYSDSRYYAVLTDGELGVSQTVPIGDFVFEDAVLKTRGAPTVWYPSRDGLTDSAIYSSQDSDYTAYFYTMTQSGDTYTLTRVRESDGTLVGTNRVLLVRGSDDTYYLCRYYSTSYFSLVSTGLKTISGDTASFTASINSTTLNKVWLTISGSNGLYSVKFQYRSIYIKAPTGTMSSSSRWSVNSNTSTKVYYDDTYGVCVKADATPVAFGITSIVQGLAATPYDAASNTGTRVQMYQYTNNAWSPLTGNMIVGGTYAVVLQNINANTFSVVQYSGGSAVAYSLGDATDITVANFPSDDSIKLTAETGASGYGVKLKFVGTDDYLDADLDVGDAIDFINDDGLLPLTSFVVDSNGIADEIVNGGTYALIGYHGGYYSVGNKLSATYESGNMTLANGLICCTVGTDTAYIGNDNGVLIFSLTAPNDAKYQWVQTNVTGGFTLSNGSMYLLEGNALQLAETCEGYFTESSGALTYHIDTTVTTEVDGVETTNTTTTDYAVKISALTTVLKTRTVATIPSDAWMTAQTGTNGIGLYFAQGKGLNITGTTLCVASASADWVLMLHRLCSVIASAETYYLVWDNGVEADSADTNALDIKVFGYSGRVTDTGLANNANVILVLTDGTNHYILIRNGDNVSGVLYTSLPSTLPQTAIFTAVASGTKWLFKANNKNLCIGSNLTLEMANDTCLWEVDDDEVI